MTGTIIKGMGGLYTVKDEAGNCYILRARGRLRKEKLTPMAGDRVSFTPGEGDIHGWLETILPRKNLCLRPPVANLDLLVLVTAPSPAPDLLLMDRLLVYACQQMLQTVICVNKSDLDPELCGRIRDEYAQTNVEVVEACALTEAGTAGLRAAMADKLSCLAGQSGVGKSTLLGQLLHMDLKIGDISRKIERGRHTTRHAELLEGNGLQVFDTPGFSLLSIPQMPPEELQAYYPEMAALTRQCRFQPCLHDQEPDCAVHAQVDAGLLSRERWARYRVLLSEAKETWRKRYD